MSMSQPLSQKVRWQLNQEAFERLLACLDDDRERAGELYNKIRGKLISYFECRDCPFPEDHADETINRVARKLESDEEIRDPVTYVYGVARLLLSDEQQKTYLREAECSLITKLTGEIE